MSFTRRYAFMFLSLVLAILLASPITWAFEAEEGVTLTPLAQEFVDSVSSEADEEMLQEWERMQKEVEKANKRMEKANGGISALASGSAPGITYSQIYYVGSTNCGWEQVDGLTYITTCNHGGVEMYTYTAELGYSVNQIATLNGGVSPYLGSVAITDSSGVVIGWWRLWDLRPHQNGYLTYDVDSANPPYGHWFDFLTIQ